VLKSRLGINQLTDNRSMPAKMHSTQGHSITQYAAQMPYKNNPSTTDRRSINGRLIGKV